MVRALPPSLLESETWRSIPPWDMPSFLEQYTLHDSSFRELRTIIDFGTLLIVDWDLVWNRQVPDRFNLLVLYFPHTYSVRWTEGAWEQSLISGAQSRIVSADQRSEMLDRSEFDLRAYRNAEFELTPPMFDESLTRTVVTGMNSGGIVLLHASDVKIVCVGPDEKWALCRKEPE